MRIFIINGPNLNLLGLREPELYGATTYESLCRSLKVYAQSLGVEVETLQSNHEGDLVDEIQRAYFDADGTQTSTRSRAARTVRPIRRQRRWKRSLGGCTSKARRRASTRFLPR